MEASPVVFLNAERLYLRAPEEADAPRCQRWVNDEENRSFISMTFPTDAIQQLAWMKSRREATYPTDMVFAIVLKEGNRHIGNCGIHNIRWPHRHGTLGILIGEKDCWGNGYGTETERAILAYAFNTLNFHRMNVAVFSHNPRSLACQKRVGFREEGRRRHAFFKHGKWEDEILLGITEEEWRMNPKTR